MDFITNLPPSKKKGYNKVFDSILVIIDRFLKICKYLPCRKTITTIKLVDLFYNEVILRIGAPDLIISDRGSVFASSY